MGRHLSCRTAAAVFFEALWAALLLSTAFVSADQARGSYAVELVGSKGSGMVFEANGLLRVVVKPLSPNATGPANVTVQIVDDATGANLMEAQRMLMVKGNGSVAAVISLAELATKVKDLPRKLWVRVIINGNGRTPCSCKKLFILSPVASEAGGIGGSPRGSEGGSYGGEWVGKAVLFAVVAVILAGIAVFGYRLLSMRVENEDEEIVFPAATASEEAASADLSGWNGRAGRAGAEGSRVELARLWVVGSDRYLSVTMEEQAFGREDFRGLVADKRLVLRISRRSKPHFVIKYDKSTNKFYIIDNKSTNGTYVNGVNIKGKGPVELHEGDIISPAKVINLRFQRLA